MRVHYNWEGRVTGYTTSGTPLVVGWCIKLICVIFALAWPLAYVPGVLGWLAEAVWLAAVCFSWWVWTVTHSAP